MAERNYLVTGLSSRGQSAIRGYPPPVFWQFLSIGAAKIAFLQKLDWLSGASWGHGDPAADMSQ